MPATVLLTIHAPTVPIVSERRLPSDVVLRSLKGRLELLCGVPVKSQKLSLWSGRTDDKDSKAACIVELDDDEQTLHAAGAENGMGLLLTDLRGDSERDQFGAEEEAKVDKYEMDEETYKQRSAYKQRMKVGRFAEQGGEAASLSSSIDSSLQVDQRCEVEGGRRGTIKFVGKTDFAKGIWIGVQYDEPVGKNDGSVNGKRYFTCTSKYGGFVLPNKVRAGDYPKQLIEDAWEEDEEM